jgi:iron complex outermembrane receptor protein
MSHSIILQTVSSVQIRRLILALSSTLLMGIGGQTFAQGSMLEEVIVTAQKREESIQDVGIAITAFSGAQLDAFGITESVAITAFTPGVHMAGNNGGATQTFTIRGATQNDFFDLAESPNAVYVDEAYMASSQSQLFAQFDMERVEILKGPQGTLFGRNATGGLVHYITKGPTKETEGYADVSYGNYDQVRFEGAVSGALTDTISARVSGFYRGHDTILENKFGSGNPEDAISPAFDPDFITIPFTAGPPNTTFADGSPDGATDLWNDDQFAVRGQLLFEPNDDVEFIVKANYAQQRLNSGPYQNVATVGELNAAGDLVNTLFSSANTNPNSCEALIVGTTGCVPGGIGLDIDVTNNTRPLPNGDLFGYVDPDGTELTTSTDHALDDYDAIDVIGFSGKLTWDLDFATLVAVSSYTSADKQQSLDVDSGPAPQLIVTNISKIDWFTQELRLEGETDKFRWIVGAYYMTIDGQFGQNLSDSIGGLNVFGGLFTPVAFGGSTQTFLDASVDASLKTDSYSIFGQLDYDLSDQLTLSVGVRGIQEEKEYVYTDNFFINTRDATVENLASGAIPLGSFLDDHSENTSDFLWSGKIGLQYAHTDDLMLYANINRGVKAGSCNAPLLTVLTRDQYCYDEEVLLSYEAGFKASLFGGKARLNATAFYYDYQDYQAFQFVGTSGAVFNVDAEYYGGEVEIFANPMDNLDIMLGLSLLDPKVKDVNVAPNVPRDVEPSFTPKTQFNALGRYTWPNSFAGGSVSVQVDGNYASSAFHNINNFGSHRMDSYWRGNARLKWMSADDKWEVTGFIDNFSDTRNQNIGFELSTVCGCDEQSFGTPRMYGARVRYNYF